MRLLFTPPAGYSFVSTAISHEGRFYALCTAYKGGAYYVHVRDLTREVAYEYRCPGTGYSKIGFHRVPGRGLCVAVSNNLCVALETGERFALVADPDGVAVPQPDRTDYPACRVWYATRERYAVPQVDMRAIGTDAHVFMTGSGARGFGDLAMGPTQHAKVMAVKGLAKGCVVSYRRGGEARVLRLPDRKHNPIHLVAADDGLTFLAVCRGAIYQIDADVE